MSAAPVSDFRLVVTGSRHWTDGEEANLIRNKLALVVEAATTLGVPSLMSSKCVTDGEILVVQGGAKGADAIAKAWALKRGLRIQTFDADWRRHGHAAGPIRNASMLDAGADVVLAFPFGDRTTSPGTWGCVDLAAARGVPVAVFPRRQP